MIKKMGFQFGMGWYCILTLLAFSSAFANPKIAFNSNTHKVHAICALLGQKEPLLYSDPQLLEQLLEQTEILLTSPPQNNQAQFEKICQLAEKNFDGLKSLQKSLHPSLAPIFGSGILSFHETVRSKSSLCLESAPSRHR